MGKGKIKIGWSSVSLVSDRPVLLSGQLYYRVSKYVHDPVTATAVVFESDENMAIMVSCDMVGIDPILLEKLQKSLDGYNGINGKNISLSAIHSHNNSSFVKDAPRQNFVDIFGEDKILQRDLPSNILDGDEATEFWLNRVVPMVKEAWDSRDFGGISVAHDYACVAFNRRPVFKDGKGGEYSKMYGTCSEDSFIRFEGPADHAADMLYTWDLYGNLTGIIVDIPCPSQVMELHYFVSADYWHYTRRQIREKLDDNVFILPLCGPAGDENPIDLIRVSKNNKEELKEWNAQVGEVWCNYDLAEECEAIGDRISDAVFRGYKSARNSIETNVDFCSSAITIKLPIRTIEEKDYLEAKAIIDKANEHYSVQNRMTSKDQVALFEPLGVISRWKLQNKTDSYLFQSNILRIGKAVFATVPFELFVDYSFRIKARAKAQNIFLAQLTNGKGGYLPTVAAINGGSYSSKPASTMCGPDGGDELVEILIKELDSLID